MSTQKLLLLIICVKRVSQADVFIHALDTTFCVEFLAFCWHVGHTTTTKCVQAGLVLCLGYVPENVVQIKYRITI